MSELQDARLRIHAEALDLRGRQVRNAAMVTTTPFGVPVEPEV